MARTDTLDDLLEDKGVSYAGMGSGASALAAPGMVTFGVCLVAYMASYLVRWVSNRDEIRELVDIPPVVSEVLATVGWWSGLVGLVLVLVLIALSIYPLRAIQLWFPTEKNRHVRRTGLRAARRWKRLARASFSPVISPGRERVYPGLQRVKVDGGHLVLRLRLPDDRVPGTRDKWLDSAANELKSELRVRSVRVENLDGRYASFFVTVRDLTEESRGVEL